MITCTTLNVGTINVTSASVSDEYLIPGSGFLVATDQPDPVGDSGAMGYSQQPIARWNVVQFQNFDDTLKIGVVAFHVGVDGVDRVEFSAEGGPWFSVDTPSLNSDSGTVEYWTTLRGSDFEDGPIEVRAIVYPTNGVPIVLGGEFSTANQGTGQHSLFLHTNAGGTITPLVRYVSPSGNDANDGLTDSTPFATPNQAAFSITQAQGSSDLGTVYLMAGDHQVTSAAWYNNSQTLNTWMTVKAAPGLDKTDVTIVGYTGSGFNSKLIKYEDVTFTSGVASGGPLEDYVWIDNCDLAGPGRLVGAIGFGDTTNGFFTRTTVHDVNTGVTGILVRDVEIDTIAGDAYSNSALVVNCVEKNQDKTGGGDIHADVYQNTSPLTLKNVILYGLTASDNLLNTAGIWQVEGDWQGLAVVNCDIVGQGNISNHAMDNILVKDSSLTAVWVGGETLSDFVFDNVTFYGGSPGAHSGVTFR